MSSTVFKYYNSVKTHVLSPNGKWLATAVMDRTVRVRNVKTEKTILEIFLKTAHAYCLDMSPDSKTLAVGFSDGVTELWDIESGKKQHEMHFVKKMGRQGLFFA